MGEKFRETGMGLGWGAVSTQRQVELGSGDTQPLGFDVLVGMAVPTQ